MSRSVGTVVQNQFTSGLITEATALNFPENAVTDTLNCVFTEKAVVSRREGFDFEEGYSTLTANQSGVLSSFLWENVGGEGAITFVVKQIGATLYFYNVPENGALSANRKSFTVDLDTYRVSGAPTTADIQCQYAFGESRLFIAHPYCDPMYIEYDSDTDNITVGQVKIKIRDLEGVDDGLGVTERPTSLSATHKYNLQNQGWSSSRISSYFSSRGDYPANSEVWWVYKDYNDAFDASLRDRYDRGTSQAPRGSRILDAFHQRRNSLTVVSSGYQRPSTIEFFAGRVFYAGVTASKFSNKIYFSRVIESDRDLGQCYQDNDPTNEFQFDLLPTDGGVVVIPEVGNIVRLLSIDGSLLVFASNGVWSIGGSTGTGFAATDYTIRRLSTVPTLDSISFVEANGVPVWWNTDGIFTIERNSSLGTIQVISLVDGKIKTFYDNIPVNSKRYAKGVFNPLERTIHWLYRSTDTSTQADLQKYDSVLCLNLLTGAFYPWRVNHANIQVKDIVVVLGTSSGTSNVAVKDSFGNDVVDSSGTTVTVSRTVSRPSQSLFKYLVSYTSGSDTLWTFAETRNENWLDWYTIDSTGSDYSSYFVTGFMVHGEGMRKFQVNYVNIFAKNDQRQSKFKFRVMWDYSTTSATNRWSPEQTVTMLPLAYGTDVRRLKVRGHGKACQFRVESVTGEPFDLVGWSVFESANQLP